MSDKPTIDPFDAEMLGLASEYKVQYRERYLEGVAEIVILKQQLADFRDALRELVEWNESFGALDPYIAGQVKEAQRLGWPKIEAARTLLEGN